MTSQPPSLQQIYTTELHPILQTLEVKRVHLRNKMALVGAIGFLIILLLAFLFKELGFFAGVFLGVPVWWLLISGELKDYQTHFKQNIIGRLIKHYDPNLQYHPGQGILQAEFRNSQIYRKSIDRYACEDLIEGKIGATTFRFSEVHAEYKTTTTDSKGNTTTHWHTIFKGIFFIADFNKHFHASTLVLPDTAEKHLGRFGQTLQSWGAKATLDKGQLIKLEDPEFERSFAVYSTDQVEARYILSTSLMQRLVEFCRQWKQPIALAFVRSNLYLAIPTNKDYFEPPSVWSKSALISIEQIGSYLNDIRLAEDIIRELNLNTRIWSKQ